MEPLVRAAALRGLPTLVDRLGGDGAGLLARFRVPVDALDTDDAVIAAGLVDQILEAAAAETDTADFGLRLAGRQDSTVLGPLAIAIENSPTLGDAFDCAARYMFVHNPALSVSRVPDPLGAPGVVGLLHQSTRSEPFGVQRADLGLGLLHRIIVVLHGGAYGLRSVHLPHPPVASVAYFTDFFGADVRFDADAAFLRVPAGLLAVPVPGGNPVLRDITLDYIAHNFSEPGQSFTDRVRLMLARSLGSAPVTLDAVARGLRTHPRTVQRRLADEQTTFERVLDDVRRTAAHRLITQTDLPLGHVAVMVGLTEQSALTRAARRWFGEPPRRLRQSAGE